MTWREISTYEGRSRAVLVATSTGIVGEAQFCGEDGWWWANSHGEYWADAINVFHGQVTHWQPLPAPPVAHKDCRFEPTARITQKEG